MIYVGFKDRLFESIERKVKTPLFFVFNYLNFLWQSPGFDGAEGGSIPFFRFNKYSTFLKIRFTL